MTDKQVNKLQQQVKKQVKKMKNVPVEKLFEKFLNIPKDDVLNLLK